MKRKLDKGPGDSVADQAIRWVTLLHADEVSVEERRRFVEWRQQSEAHSTAYEEMEKLWHTLDGPSASLGANLSDDYLIALFHSAPEQVSPPRPYRQASQAFRQRPRRSLALAVAALVFLIVGGAWFTEIASVWRSDYHTAKGEQRSILLADGSTVILNTDSALSLRFSEQTRTVTLDKGEAFFLVKPEVQHPFIVAAGSGAIRVVGTEFNVYQRDDQVTVTVQKGTVEVSPEEPRPGSFRTPTRVTGGQHVSYSTTGEIGNVMQTTSGEAFAWQRGQLVFTLQPLATVVAELNRYRAGRIFILDPRLRELVVSGVFTTAELDEALKAMENTLAIRSLRLTNYMILLYR